MEPNIYKGFSSSKGYAQSVGCDGWCIGSVLRFVFIFAIYNKFAQIWTKLEYMFENNGLYLVYTI